MERENIQKFLNMELTAETEDYEKKFSAKAIHLLNETEELFIGQFLMFKNGEMIVKFRTSRAFPRKGEYLQCMYLPKELQDYKKWDDSTFEHLFKNRLKGTEAVCIWQTKSNEEGFVVLGFRGIDINFEEFINQAPGALLFFGPHRPPIEYLSNLFKLSQDTWSQSVNDILDYPYETIENGALLIKEGNAPDFIHQQIQNSSITLLQGPPGTGKTHLIAEICSRLCSDGKSVLVTALTNRALIEVASKDVLSDMLTQGSILKSNLTADEHNELPKLLQLKQIVPMPYKLELATYYIVSGFASELAGDGVFDYVIMDEASQALFPMFAAVRKIAKTALIVGDIAQLGPVVSLNEDRIKSNDFKDIINGLSTISEKRIFPKYQLTKTYRLTQRGADFTSIFYKGALKSESKIKPTIIEPIKNAIHSYGGPSLILTNMEVGSHIPQYALDIATFIVHAINEKNKGLDIAVLTCFRKTVRALQKAISLRLGIENKIIIDTVARVQGLTTDITLFFIPNVSMIRSLDSRLFNVATSRSKQHTIIIADENILSYPHMDIKVRKYLERLAEDCCFIVPPAQFLPNGFIR